MNVCYMYMYVTLLGIVDMARGDTLAIPAPGQDPGPDQGPVLAAPSDVEGEVGEILTEDEGTPIAAHQVDLEAGAEVETVAPRLAGEVGGAISHPPHGRGEDRIPGVPLHIWIGQGHVLVPIPKAGLGRIPIVLSHLPGSRGQLPGHL